MGASSGIGRLAVDTALARGHRVRGLARSAAGIEAGPGFDPAPGDARDPAAVEAALDGADAVVQCLGVRERPAMLWQEETLFSDATRILVAAMRAHGPRRLIAVTGFGAGDSRAAMSRLERLGHGAVLGKVYADKTRQEALIEDSGLDWTIVRPVILTKGRAKGRFRVLLDPAEWRNGLISRADVAAFLIDQVEDPALIGRKPVIAY